MTEEEERAELIWYERSVHAGANCDRAIATSGGLVPGCDTRRDPCPACLEAKRAYADQQLIFNHPSINAGPDCDRAIRWTGEPAHPGCNTTWDPCPACLEAKRAYAAKAQAANNAYCKKWLEGMRAYDEQQRARQKNPGPPSAYPTAGQQLRACWW